MVNIGKHVRSSADSYSGNCRRQERRRRSTRVNRVVVSLRRQHYKNVARKIAIREVNIILLSKQRYMERGESKEGPEWVRNGGSEELVSARPERHENGGIRFLQDSRAA
jgi:hypothetical protein